MVEIIYLDYINVENENIIKIHKSKVSGSKMMTTTWSFEMNRVYEEEVSFEELFENELICSDYYATLMNGLRGTFIFVVSNTETFLSKEYNTIGEFLRKKLEQIFNIFDNTGYRRKEGMFITVSMIEIYDNKYRDCFNFENLNRNNIKLNEYSDEICIEGVKEIQIKSIEQYQYLINLVADKRSKIKIKESEYKELFTIKMYKTGNDDNILISKFNLLLYKGYSLSKIDGKEYSINTKDNFNFFSTLKDPSLRLCKINRMLRVYLAYLGHDGMLLCIFYTSNKFGVYYSPS
jgi:hypothetical protein